MNITQAIECGENEHVVYFLLTAYLESLDFHDAARAVLPPQVKALPLQGRRDVSARLRALHACQQAERECASGSDVAGEALEIFGAAAVRLDALESFTRRLVCAGALAAHRPDWRAPRVENELRICA